MPVLKTLNVSNSIVLNHEKIVTINNHYLQYYIENNNLNVDAANKVSKKQPIGKMYTSRIIHYTD